MLKDRYINPLTDYGFKKLFGTEVNKDLLIDFLNQILPEHHRVKDLSYLQNERMPSAEVDRKAVFDIYCESESGEKFIVEMQKAKQNFFKDRSVFYMTFPIQEQAKKGDWNFELSAVYAIGILDFIFDDSPREYSGSAEDAIQTIYFKNQHNDIFFDKLNLQFIELPKFTLTEDQLVTQKDKWLYVLRHLAYLNNRPETLRERVFTKVFEQAEISKFTPEERGDYESSLKYYRDIKNVIDTAKGEGFSEGMEKGKEEGIIEGMEKGKLEKNIEIARSMKSKGLDNSIITDITGLTKGEIDKL
ncbi:MAG: Rpn family recombination-promoting nuclease/putative transposase [Bacteroidales bacterium]